MSEQDAGHCPERTRLMIMWCEAVAAYRAAVHRLPNVSGETDAEAVERLMIATENARAVLEAHVRQHEC